MKLLILGGTKFVGRHLMEQAAPGENVTVFHRGKTRCPLPTGVREMLGDRETDDIRAVATQSWDLVVDTCGYYPQTVRRSADALRPWAKRYLFVSSVSAYADLGRAGLQEDDALAELPAGLGERPDVNEYYGPLKSACEHVVEEVFGKAGTIVRPGLIVGPYDPTDRFTYWVERLADGGDVLAPGSPDAPVQFIDVRDLAAFVLKLATRELGGAFNAIGPTRQLNMAQMLEAGIDAVPSRSGVRLQWRSDTDLLVRGAKPWTDLPLWIPLADPESAGVASIDRSKSAGAGLENRPIAQTFSDTFAWASSLPPDRERKAGITRERERQLL